MDNNLQPLSFIPTRYVSILITLTNGKTFPNGSPTAIFKCNSSSSTDIDSGGYTCRVKIRMTGALLNNTAEITIYGLDQSWRKPMGKLQSMNMINSYENWVEVYAGYRLNADGLPDFQYRGMIQRAMYDGRAAKKSFTMNTMSVYQQLYLVTSKNISSNGDMALTKLFDLIVKQAPKTQLWQLEFVPGDLSGRTATDAVYSGGSWVNMLNSACEQNYCIPPIFVKNKIYIVSKDHHGGLSPSVATLTKRHIVDTPYPDESGASQIGLDVRFNGELNFGQRIRIQGEEFDDIYTSFDLYINGMTLFISNREKDWKYQLSLGQDFYNIAQTTNPNRTNTNTTTTTLLDKRRYLGIPSDAGAVDATDISPSQQQNSPVGGYVPPTAAYDLLSSIGFILGKWKKLLDIAILCEVIEVDNDKNLYTVQETGVLINENGTTQQPRVIYNVPAMMPFRQKAKLVKGDKVQVVCNQYDISLIKRNKYKRSYVKSTRSNSVSDAVIIAMPQDLNDSNNCAVWDKDNVEFTFEDHISFKIAGSDSSVVMKKDKIVLKCGQSETTLENGDTIIKCGLGQIKVNSSGEIDLGAGLLKSILLEGLLTLGGAETPLQVNIAGLGQTTLEIVPASDTVPASQVYISGGSSKVKAVK